MKKLLLSMTALATLATGVVATPAAAQRYANGNGNWQNINQRQANLYERIEQGVRNGSLTRREATQLRTRFVQLNRMEQAYRRNGLTQWERRDLDRRFDQLSHAIRVDRHDGQNQNRPWRR